MDVASVSAGLQGLTFAKDAFSAILKLKVDADTMATVSEALRKVEEAQGALFAAREQLFALQAERDRLQRELDTQNNWERRLAAYALAQTKGKAVVYVSQRDPKHYVCPACTEKKELHILQPVSNSGSMRCPACKYLYDIDRDPPYPFSGRG